MLSTNSPLDSVLDVCGSPKIGFSNFFSQNFLMLLGVRHGCEPVLSRSAIPHVFSNLTVNIRRRCVDELGRMQLENQVSSPEKANTMAGDWASGGSAGWAAGLGIDSPLRDGCIRLKF
jgi:hypothetical protein